MEDKYWIPLVQNAGQTMDVYSSMLAEGIIFVNTRIDQRVAGLITSCLLHITGRKDQAVNPKIYLNTQQGDVLAALTVVDIIEFYKRRDMQIQTVGFGEVGLATSIIMACGTHGLRKIAAHGQICLRVAPGNLEFGNVESEQAKARQRDKIVITVIDMLTSYSGQEKDYFRACLGAERYLSAEEAIEIGLVDEIIG
jgi:ATP-dependent Clp protease, protease subunit